MAKLKFATIVLLQLENYVKKMYWFGGNGGGDGGEPQIMYKGRYGVSLIHG